MDFFQFIDKYLNEDPFKLRLKFKDKLLDFDVDSAIDQIECRKKYASKLSRFLSFNNFIFPDLISGEQASHQAVAKFHASLISPGQTVLDMTAGLGIDSLSFAFNKNEVSSIEIDSKKANVLNSNIESMQLKNIEVVNVDSLDYLKSTIKNFDVIFIDPARRDENSKRVYNLRDCVPDVITNIELLSAHSDQIFIKASPLLDISQTIKDFKNVNSIKAIGVKGECKEILIEIKGNKAQGSPILVEAINLGNNGEVLNLFSDVIDSNSENNIHYASVTDLEKGIYILEPSAMVMKLAPWPKISNLFKAKKFGKSTHLFLTDSYPKDFPGRVTRFERLIKKQDRKSLHGFPASVVSRNYPLTSEKIRKEFHLKEGDKYFIYASRLGENPLMLLSESISC